MLHVRQLLTIAACNERPKPRNCAPSSDDVPECVLFVRGHTRICLFRKYERKHSASGGQLAQGRVEIVELALDLHCPGDDHGGVDDTQTEGKYEQEWTV